MLNKNVLIAEFVKKNRILRYLEFLKSDMHIKYDKIFVFNIEGNTDEYLVTFKASKKEFFLKSINNSTIMHVKNGCLFSINALNKLIEEKNGSLDKEYQLNWEEYQNKLIILTNGELIINNINKIEDKCIFFE